MIMQDGEPIALKRSKNRRIVKNPRNRIETPSACAYYPFILLSFKQPSESSKYVVAWFSQNHKTANPAREPHVKWQRPRFLSFLFPSSPAGLLFFFSPAISATERLLCGGERFGPEKLLVGLGEQ